MGKSVKKREYVTQFRIRHKTDVFQQAITSQNSLFVSRRCQIRKRSLRDTVSYQTRVRNKGPKNLL